MTCSHFIKILLNELTLKASKYKYATQYGIGYYIMNSWIEVDYEGMYVGIILISILGIIMFKVIDVIQNKICKWKIK